VRAFLFSLLVLSMPLAAAEKLTGEQKRGRNVFQACSGCHNVLTDARKAAPSLRTLFGKVRMRNGKRTTEDNVAQLILDGYNGMPSYRNMFRPEDWSDLLAYLKTLRARPEVGSVLNPVRGSDQEILVLGRKLFGEQCGACHDRAGSTAPAVLDVYSREQLASGESVKEATLIQRIRDNHAGKSNPPVDETALFALIALLKAYAER
jgi:predicted CXXCH cytochrome family protein